MPIDHPPEPFADLICRQAATCGPTVNTSFERVASEVTRVAGFSNQGKSASGHIVPVDEPEQFGGSGKSADPAELLLIAIGASISVTLTAHAAIAGIVLDDIRVELRGTLDAARFFYPIDAEGGGFVDLSLGIILVTATADETVKALLDRALLASPVIRSITAKPTVSLTILAE